MVVAKVTGRVDNYSKGKQITVKNRDGQIPFNIVSATQIVGPLGINTNVEVSFTRSQSGDSARSKTQIAKKIKVLS